MGQLRHPAPKRWSWVVKFLELTADEKRYWDRRRAALHNLTPAGERVSA